MFFQMASSDRIPNIEKGREFPIGDIVDAAKDARVDQWLDTVGSLSHQNFLEFIKINSQPRLLNQMRPNKTDLAALGLCHKWDYGNGHSAKYTYAGYNSVIAFNRQVNYLPESDIDFSNELNQMSQREVDGGILNSQREFGRVAWNSMAIYPNVHLTFFKLLEFIEPRYGIFTDKDRDCLKAGMALPFLLSWTAGLASLTPEFTSFSDTSNPDEKDAFHSRFSNEIPLAPDNPKDRKIT